MGNKRRKKRKSLNFLDIYNSIRQTWTINPKTKVKQSKKKFNRAREKRQTRKDIQDET